MTYNQPSQQRRYDTNFLTNTVYDGMQGEENLNQYGFEPKLEELSDLFVLKPFYLSNPQLNREKFKCFCVSKEQIIIVTDTNTVYRWKYTEESQIVGYSLPLTGKQGYFSSKQKGNPCEIQDVFLDPQGHHCIISGALQGQNGENFYFPYNSDQIIPLQKLKGFQIKSIAWDQNTELTHTNDFLLGTRDGQILLWNLNQRELEAEEIVEQVILEEKLEAQSIKYLELMVLEQKYGKTLIVVASQSNNLYCFHGNSELKYLFSKYKDPAKFREAKVPMPPQHFNCAMDICYDRNFRPHSFIWTNGGFITYYTLPKKEEIVDQKFIQTPQYYKYHKKVDSGDGELLVQEMPVGLGLTEYHYYILHSDGITIISRITESVVEHHDLSQMGQVQGMVYVSSKPEVIGMEKEAAFWIYSTNQILKLDVSNEDKDAWRLYLKMDQCDKAYNICKNYQHPQTNYIGSLYADDLFYNQKNYIEAAQLYFETNRSFEQIFLKFITNQSHSDKPQLRDGLEYYLQRWLNKMQEFKEKNTHQFTIIISWLVELKVYKMNSVDRQLADRINNQEISDSTMAKQFQDKLRKLKESQEKLNRNFNNFLEKHILNQGENIINLVYQILQSHGRLQNCIEFAKKQESYETIVIHHINEENYSEALNYLEKLKFSPKKFEDILLKYCHLFMQQEPQKTINVLVDSKIINKNSKNFNFTKLIGGLMNIQPKVRSTEGVKFLEHCISKLNPSEKIFETMNNILIFFLTEPLQIDKLMETLKEAQDKKKETERWNFDLDFVLRLLKRNPNTEKAQIQIYSMMELYQESVNLALKHGYVELAKDKAKVIGNDELSKKLQIDIAKYLLAKGSDNVQEVIALTNDEQIQIKIEDLLLYFNENIKIEDFKEEICRSLKDYSQSIDTLKAEMDLYSKNAEQLKNEARLIKNKCVELDSTHVCEVCQRSMFVEEFYIFPCKHGFHKRCLLDQFRNSHIDQQKLQEIQKLDRLISDLVSKSNSGKQQQNRPQAQDTGFFSFANLSVFGGKEQDEKKIFGLTAEEEYRLKESKDRFDFLLAKECIYCGPSIVDSIFMPFESNEEQKASWAI